MEAPISIATDVLLQTAKKRVRSRRWPWQPQTVRGRLNDWRADLALLAAAQGEVLLEYVRQQSRPRRWPWQPKTVRDHINARSAELAALAAERSAELAATVAVRSAELAAPLVQRRDALVAEVKKQARPRRWPWQSKTTRDRLNERSAKLAALAATRSAELAAQAAARRDLLISEARKQARPRRWPWQPKTARDRLNERTVALKSSAADQVATVQDTIQQVAKIGAGAAGAAVAGAAVAAAQARKAADQAQALPQQVLPTIKDQASAAGAAVQNAVAAVPDVLGTAASSVTSTIKDQTSAAGAAVQSAVSAVPDVLGSATSSVTGTLKEAASSVSKSARSSKKSRPSLVQATVRAPVDAVNYRIKAGRKTVNHGVQLVTTAARWALIGFIIGLLTSPASGKELRRQLRDAVMRVVDGILQAD